MSITRLGAVRRLTLSLVGALALLAAVTAHASAGTAYAPAGEFGDPGSGDGQFTAPRDVAVEADTGNVFVVDRDNDRVQVFAANAPADYLTQFGAGTLDDPVGIAIDQSNGNVYVTDSANNRIVKFDSDGQPTPSFSEDAGFTSPALGNGAGEVGSFDVAIAVDPATGDLLVADRENDRVSRYDSTGSFDSSFDGSTSPGGAFTGPLDIAVDSTGDVVVVDSATGSISDVVFGSSSRVERFDSAGAHEHTIGASVPSPGAVTTDPDTDEVLIAGNFQSWNNSQPLRVYTFESDGTPGSDFPLGNQTLYSVVPGLAVDGGASERLYVVTDVFQGYGDVTVQVFEPLAVAPPVVTSSAASVGEITATLRGAINPGNLATDYHFEYGATASYGTSTSTATVAAGETPVDVSRSIGGLQPGTTYHYRLVATNAEGTTEGDDTTFTTKSATPPQPAPDSDRRYEMVSPPDKNNNDVARTSTRTQSAPSGDKVTYVSTGGFADAPGAGKTAQYLSERTAIGWATRGINPAAYTNEFTLAIAPIFRDFTDDLSKGAVVSPEPAPVDGAPPTTHNIFVRDNLADQFSLITTAAPAGADYTYQPVYAGGSDDFGHVIFESTGALTPDAPDDGTIKLYESTGGQLRLVGVMPDGSPAPGGSVAGVGKGVLFDLLTHSAISRDGSRIYFTAQPQYSQVFAADGQIYLREDGAQTVHVSASQRTVPDPAGTLPAMFRGASADGGKALLTSCEKLTDDSTADAAGGSDCAFAAKRDLFQYDVASGELELLSEDSEPEDGDEADVAGVAGQSSDGQYVYFAAFGRLTSEAPADAGSQPKLYLWHDGEVRFVALLSSFDTGNSDNVIYEPTAGSRAVRVSRDGRQVFFTSYGSQDSTDLRRDAYLYRADEDELRCVSCQGEGQLGSDGATLVQGTADGLSSTQIEYDSRALLDDGSRVFFSSDERLVSHDTNGRFDAYEYDVASEAIRLVSSGQSSTDSFFSDASADGRDVFFVTRERLVGWDRDNNVDLYDARIGGGFPEPPADAGTCEDDGCQGPLAGQPVLSGVASDKASGAGDVPTGARAVFSVRSLTRAQKAALARGRGVVLKVTVNRAGRVRAAARARVGGKTRVVATRSRLARRAGPVRLRLRLTSSARRQLARGGSLRISLQVRFSGASAPKQRTLNLKTRGTR